MEATINGNADDVAALLAADADVNKAGAGGTTPLIMACLRGSVQVVNALLSARNVDANKASPQRVCSQQHATPLLAPMRCLSCTSLPFTLHRSWLLITSLLLQADTSKQTTPLMVAASHGHTRIIAALLKASGCMRKEPPMHLRVCWKTVAVLIVCARLKQTAGGQPLHFPVKKWCNATSTVFFPDGGQRTSSPRRTSTD